MDSAVGSVLPPLIGAALPADVASTLEALLLSRVGTGVDLLRMASRLECGIDGALDALQRAERSFHSVFGMYLLPAHRRWEEGADPDPGAPKLRADAPDRVPLGRRFVDLLDRGHTVKGGGADAVPPNRDFAVWLAAIAAARASGTPLQLALRCVPGDDTRVVARTVSLLAAWGLEAVGCEVDGPALAGELLRAELHSGPSSPLLVIGGNRLVEPRPDADRDPGALGAADADAPTRFAVDARPWLGTLRGVLLWCVPHDAVIPPCLEGVVAGCVGPIRTDPSLSRTLIAAEVGGGVGPLGVSVLAETLSDPSEAGARAAAVRMLATTGMHVDDACRFVARSLAPPTEEAEAPTFDSGLVCIDGEVALLFERAREVALAAGRVLFTGPPGGGKSTLARALAHRMAESGAAGPPVVVTAASILVRAYGGTERLLEQLWRRAALAGAPLVVDELDAMCGVRDGGGPDGNAYLVRVLTDEWIRQFDAHPSVPVLATCNDVAAVDPAIRRRFAAVYEIAAELTPALERRAWTSLFDMDPPSGWAPCGAAPSDFAAARARCRMLGLLDAASLAGAVVRARDARRGTRAAKLRGVLH